MSSMTTTNLKPAETRSGGGRLLRVLAVAPPRLGHLYPIVPTLCEVVRRGHSVSIRAPRAQVPHLRSLGIDADASEPKAWPGESDEWAPSGLADSPWADSQIAEVRDSIAIYRPDVVLVDASLWQAGAAVETSGIPWAYAAPFSLPLPSRDVPPFGLGLTPRHDFIGRLRDALVRALLTKALDARLTHEMNVVRRRLQLKPIRAPGEVFLRAPLVICFTAEPFEYPRSDWPPNVRLVGPALWDPPARLPEWPRGGSSDPMILVACSSETQRDDLLVRTAIEAFGGTGVRVLITAPTAANFDRFPSVPNVRLERFVSHSATIPRAQCVVCHGGMGITQKALAFGVPVCVVPFDRDQFEVAQRVKVVGAGSAIKPWRLNARRLAAAVSRALDSRERAERVAGAFATAGGAERAASELVALTTGDLAGYSA